MQDSPLGQEEIEVVECFHPVQEDIEGCQDFEQSGGIRRGSRLTSQVSWVCPERWHARHGLVVAAGVLRLLFDGCGWAWTLNTSLSGFSSSHSQTPALVEEYGE